MKTRVIFQIIGLLFFIFITGFKVIWSQTNDPVYAEKIKEYTTDSSFINDLVDHMPQSEIVPSPLQHFGEIIGAPGILHNTEEIYGYYQALADASPRVKMRSIGKTEEDREMFEIIIANEKTITNLESYREYLNQIADPRNLSEPDAKTIITQAKPIYYVIAGLHSPETGSPEMLMELAFRLAVEDSPIIKTIRENIISVFVTVAEPDGRDRVVDIYNYRKDHRDVGPSLIYWGHYVAHDNNRDGFGLTLALTRNILNSFLYWKPTVMHDLHESIPYLYVSTGTGPYNEYIDPITINEWHNISHEEVTELTKRGMPGVWTHGFYSGWAANYLLWIANTRNSIGRFYETFGNSIPDTKERELSESRISRVWYRPYPPLKKTMWSFRNNINYMQSGVLIALKYVADNRFDFVDNFYIKTKNAIQAGRNEAPYAWVIPREQKRPNATISFINLLLQQGVEVQQADQQLNWSLHEGKEETETGSTENKADKEVKTKLKKAPKGSFIIRMDQPYRTLVRILLDKQNFPKDASPTYDDTGWCLPLLRQVKVWRVDDPNILNAKMSQVIEPVQTSGLLEGKGKPYYILNNNTEDNITVFRFKLKDIKMLASETSFEVDKHKYEAGSLIIPAENNPADLVNQLQHTVQELGLTVQGVSNFSEVPTHDVEVPRVALVHTWISTPQDAGWWRYAFDHIGIPYTYLSEQELATTDLSLFDVIILPRTRASSQNLVSGTSMVGDPIPWKQTEKYQHIGLIDETEDMRLGMGYDGVKHLKEFIESGGVFITEGSTASFPIDMAITRRIRIRQTRDLQARGTVLQSMVNDTLSPIIYGYNDSLAVYFSQSPVFRVDNNVGNYRTPDWFKDEVWAKEVPRVILKFPKKNILLSGMLKGEEELAGAPAVVDIPVGKGHVVLFAIRPFWRWETHGSHALVFNTMLHWNDLRVGWPERPEEK